MACLIQILLPLCDNHQHPFPDQHYRLVEQELKDRFGGMTAYARSPARGIWKSDGMPIKEDIVVYEVMSSTAEEKWWEQYRQRLEQRFEQDEIVIRALSIQRL